MIIQPSDLGFKHQEKVCDHQLETDQNEVVALQNRNLHPMT